MNNEVVVKTKSQSSGYFINKKKVIVPLLIIIAVVLFGTSYALWQLTFTQSGTNTMTSGCLKLSLTNDTDAIDLNNALPISDVDGKKLTPYTFTIENLCSSYTHYYINLETLNNNDKVLPDKYVKANLVSTADDRDMFVDTLTSTYINTEKAIEDAQNAYMLYDGELEPSQKLQFSLKLWMDEDTSALDEVMNATWEGKITVIASYVPLEDKKNVMVKMEFAEKTITITGYDVEYQYNATYTRDGKYNDTLKNIEFQSVMSPYAEAEEIVDFSLLQDRSVLGYYVKNEDNTTYNLYIQADGKIKVNPIASYYGLVEINNTHEIMWLENLDTSEVCDMSYMFAFYRGEILDLGSFDTSKVTNMSNMFYRCISLLCLDLSSFDTSNVTTMYIMFRMCRSLVSLDLSRFDTSNVTTMYMMFDDCSSLTSLDSNSFDTSKVTNMSYMFSNLNLATLDLSNFSTTNVTDMSYMFAFCRGEVLDLGSFDTSKVTNMNGMFWYCNGLTTLELSNFDTSNVTDMGSMFSGCSSLTTLDLSSFNT